VSCKLTEILVQPVIQGQFMWMPLRVDTHKHHGQRQFQEASCTLAFGWCVKIMLRCKIMIANYDNYNYSNYGKLWYFIIGW